MPHGWSFPSTILWHETTDFDHDVINPAPTGAMDMSGNVLEWVNDWFDESYYSNSTYANPQGPISGRTRVARGGNWHTVWLDVRTAARAGGGPGAHVGEVGIRCAVSPGE